MERRAKQDLKISGSASAGGGSYNNVVISGQGNIDGDFDCADLRISGASKLDGNVEALTVKITGTANITGDFKVNDCKVSGFAQVHGNIKADEMRIEGAAVAGSNVSADWLEIKGGLKVKSECSAENFVSKGAFTVGGLLNSDRITIELYGPCRAKEIGGENITVRKGPGFHFARIVKTILSSFDVDSGLVAESIEGDEIYLEETKAKVVRGNNVMIGEGCEIGLVEYRSKFEQRGNSTVRENRKVRR